MLIDQPSSHPDVFVVCSDIFLRQWDRAMHHYRVTHRRRKQTRLFFLGFFFWLFFGAFLFHPRLHFNVNYLKRRKTRGVMHGNRDVKGKLPCLPLPSIRVWMGLSTLSVGGLPILKHVSSLHISGSCLICKHANVHTIFWNLDIRSRYVTVYEQCRWWHWLGKA